LSDGRITHRAVVKCDALVAESLASVVNPEIRLYHGITDLRYRPGLFFAGPQHFQYPNPFRGGADLICHSNAVSHFAFVADWDEINIQIKA